MNVRSVLVCAGLVAILTGCATTPASPAAERVQLLRQDNTLAATCKRLGPVTATVARVAPARVVYDDAVLQAREQAAGLGADAMMLMDTSHEPGLTNKIVIQGAALKCYSP